MPTERHLSSYATPDITEEDIAAVVSVLQSGWLTTGPTVDRLEQAFTKTVAARNAVACSSGTAALHLAYRALGIGPGDTVIVPVVTFVATASAAILCGARVVFADVDSETGLCTSETIREAVDRARSDGHRVKAITPVHLNGQSVNMAAIGCYARDEELFCVEDACHAVGGLQATSGGTAKPVGSCSDSDVAVFSFHAVKTVAGGEGGMLTCNDMEVARRARVGRNHGILRDPDTFARSKYSHDQTGAPNPWYYEVGQPGFNYRLSDIHAVLALSQLNRLEESVRERSKIVAAYEEAISSGGDMVRPIGRIAGGQTAWHLNPVLINFGVTKRDRAYVMKHLAQHGIGTQVHYMPLDLHPAFQLDREASPMPGGKGYYDRVLSLPLHGLMRPDDVEQVVTRLLESLHG